MKAPIQKYTRRLLLMLLILGTGFSGCKKFLDVNEDPNNPVNAQPRLLLPTVQASIGQIVGNAFQIYGNFFAQYWAQNPSSSQYRSLEQYRLTNADFDRPWLTLYRNALQNAQVIIEHPEANNERIKGIASILKAYTFQVTTDAFGDIPLSEAVRGSEITSPRYESQEQVYDSIFRYVNEGLAIINTANALSPGEQDLIFQGNVDSWTRFANTLKLRAYMRLSQVKPAEAQAGIAALYSAGAQFLVTDASVQYSTTGGNENPLYNEMLGLDRTQNIVASRTAVSAYLANNDPRLFRFYEPLPGQDTISNIPQGSYNLNTGKEVSPPSALVGAHATNPASANAPVKLISAAESYFLQAEAVARGWAPGDVTQLFQEGIRQSFLAVGIPAEAGQYILTAPDAQLPGTPTGNIRAIITQKYYAMNGFQGFEAWTEWRRTGYPDFLRTSVASTIGAGRMPLRFLYPNNEITTNQNFPETRLIYEPVWWDVQ